MLRFNASLDVRKCHLLFLQRVRRPPAVLLEHSPEAFQQHRMNRFLHLVRFNRRGAKRLAETRIRCLFPPLLFQRV